MVDLVPKLELIIGEQPPVPELSPQDAQRRFQFVLRRFIGVFARQEHPLALFLDDLQWLDAATLDLLEDLLTRSALQHLMLIGAYRDNEVTAAHPLTRKLEAIRNAGASVQEVKLAPLAREDVGRLVGDALRCDAARAAPLPELVHGKTAGNPFFVIQFLSALADEGLLAFDHDAARWSWDVGRIHAKGYTDNVVDLMVGKLSRLPARRRRRCSNSPASATARTWQRSRSCAGHRRIRSTRTCGRRFAWNWSTDSRMATVRARPSPGSRLLADRGSVARASAPANRQVTRGADTARGTRGDDLRDRQSTNRGAALITAPDEREQLAELNLNAGKRAKASTAYASALSYLVAGAGLLADDVWGRRPALIFALELHRAECEFLTGELVAAEERLTMLASRSAATVEQATVACLRMDLYITLDRSDRAVDIGLTYLRHLGSGVATSSNRRGSATRV